MVASSHLSLYVLCMIYMYVYMFMNKYMYKKEEYEYFILNCLLDNYWFHIVMYPQKHS